MREGSTLTLKIAIIFLALVVLALCIFVLPTGIISDKAGGYRPIIFGMYVTAIPFFIALYQALRLLRYIDKNHVFSLLSVNALKSIKYCAAMISALYAAGMPYIYYVADLDDAPGVVALGLIVVFVSFVIAAAAALFQNLLRRAIEIKSENDLTV